MTHIEGTYYNPYKIITITTKLFCEIWMVTPGESDSVQVASDETSMPDSEANKQIRTSLNVGLIFLIIYYNVYCCFIIITNNSINSILVCLHPNSTD
jgi:hypothetical protein